MNGRLLFSKEHMWVLIDGNVASVGISDYAQKRLKAVVFLNLPDVGEKYEVGDRIGDVESVKNVSDLISPITGTILEVNDNLVDEPYLINEEPYNAWLIKMHISSVPEDLMDEETYKGKLNV